MNEREQPSGERRSMVEDVSAEQARSFAILRRPLSHDDPVPRGRDDPFAGGFIVRRGLNAALARRATTPVGDVWVVPGNGHIALYTGSTTCGPTGVVARQGLVMWGPGAKRPEVLVYGVVPDGVEEVTLCGTEGSPTKLPVADNVYGTLLTSQLRSVSFEGAEGTIELGPWDA